MAGRGEREVRLSITARDNYSRQLKQAQTAVERLQAAQTRRQDKIADTRRQIQEIDQIRAAYKEASAQAANYGQALGRNARSQNLTAEEEREIRDALAMSKARMQELTAEIDRRTAALKRATGAQRTYADFIARTASIEERQAVHMSRADRVALAARKVQEAAQADDLRSRRDTALAPQEIVAPEVGPRMGQMRTLQQAALDVRREYEALSAETAAYGRALAQTDAPTEQMIADFERARAAQAAMRAEIERTDAALAQHRQKGAGGFAALAPTLDVQAIGSLDGRIASARAELARLNAEADNLAVALGRTDNATDAMIADFDRAQTAAEKLRREISRLETVQTASAGAARAQAGGADGGGWWSRLTGQQVDAMSSAHERGPLGLRPYELTNLGYQINDLATQIASGTPITQAFAQQIGQIAQIFPDATLAVLRFAPAAAVAVAAIAPLVGALQRLNETASLEKGFAKLLAPNADGARWDPTGLTNMVREYERLGIAVEESQAAIQSMASRDIGTEKMREFLSVAQDAMLAIPGFAEDIPSAVERVADAFDGTLDSVLKLDEELNFLTAEQVRQAKAMAEQGREAEAAETLLRAFEETTSSIAESARGEWSQAFATLRGGWSSLLDAIGNTGPIYAAGEALSWLSSMAAGAISAIGSAMQALSDYQQQRKEVDAQLYASDSLTGAARRWANNTLFGAPAPEPQTPLDSLPPPTTDSILYPGMSEKAIKEEQARVEKAQKQAITDTAKHLDDVNRLVKDANDAINREFDKRDKAADAIDADNIERVRNIELSSMSDRDQARQKAIWDAERKAAQGNIELTAEQRTETERLALAEYDAAEAAEARAKAAREAAKSGGGGGGGKRKKGEDADDAIKKRRNELEKTLNDLLEWRAQLLANIEMYREKGDETKAVELEGRMVGLNEKILAATESLRQFYKTLGGPEAEGKLLWIDTVEQDLESLKSDAITTGEQMNEALADGLSSGIGDVAQAIGEGESAIKALGLAAREFAARFLIDIGQMIAKQLILNALQGGGGEGGGVGGILANAVNAFVRHGGGTVGGPVAGRLIPASLFANAPRYHGGGVAGLRPGEVPAILRKEEEVLTRQDPRHVMNGGRGGDRSPLNVKVVNVVDPTELLEKALSSAAGERVLVNHFARNATKLKGILG